MRNNTVNTQGRAGSLWGGHGVGPVPEPLTFCRKSLRSELPLNVFGKVRCLALAPEGPVLSCTPSTLLTSSTACDRIIRYSHSILLVNCFFSACQLLLPNFFLCRRSSKEPGADHPATIAAFFLFLYFTQHQKANVPQCARAMLEISNYTNQYKVIISMAIKSQY